MAPTFLAILALVAAACGGTSGGGGDDAPGQDASGQDGSDGDPDGGTPDGDVTTCAATELCDGVLDDDCDGQVDEDCGRCPLMTVACSAGCCPVDRWEVSTNPTVGADLAVDTDGTIYFAYSVPGPSWVAYLAIYDPAPGTWRTMQLGTGTNRNRVRIDHLGRVHVAYGGNIGTLNYRRSDDRGATFSTPTALGQLAIGGTFDMEIDSAGQPHVVFAQYSTQTPTSRFHYKHLDGAQWVTDQPDIVTMSISHPDLALGFADRPHVVFETYDGVGVRTYLFHNGNRWVLETADMATSGQGYTGNDYHAGHSLRIAPGDVRELLVTRRIADVDTMLLATRGAGDLDTWQVAPITGATDFVTPVMFVDPAGKLAAVGDGLRLYRQQSGATWTTTSLGVPGENVAVARRGSHFYIAYSADNEHPTLTVIELD